MNDGAQTSHQFLQGGGELGELIRAHNWSATPLGPPEQWPQSLRSAVSILLPSRAQICLFWGPELITIYNDAYRPTRGIKHPWALGRPAREVWKELWDDILQELLGQVVKAGKAFGLPIIHSFWNGMDSPRYYCGKLNPLRPSLRRA